MQPCDHFRAAFRQRCAEELERLGDVAADVQQHDDAIARYSAAISLIPLNPFVFVKRSKVYLADESWEDAIRDANQVSPPRFACGSFLSTREH